jgi:hypothetical protein
MPLQRVVVPIGLSTAAGGALSVALTWTSALRARDRDAPPEILEEIRLD